MAPTYYDEDGKPIKRKDIPKFGEGRKYTAREANAIAKRKPSKGGDYKPVKGKVTKPLTSGEKRRFEQIAKKREKGQPLDYSDRTFLKDHGFKA